MAIAKKWKGSVVGLASVFLALAVFSSVALAATTTLSTSDNRFDVGIDNQGWWSPTLFNTDGNDNYFTGRTGSRLLRDFFTFDLSGLDGCTVSSATLELTHASSFGNNPHVLGIFDVTTDAATLNNNTGTSAAIYNDLGTGTQYASVSIPNGASGTESISLNAAAITDINAAIPGFFSVGGSLQNLAPFGSDYLFGASGSSSNKLTVDFSCNEPPVCDEAAPSIDAIWPPNHKFVDINVLGVTDPDGDAITITVDSIFQDEATDTFGDGAFTPDATGVGTDTAAVRAERAGTKEMPGDGRVYHIAYTADDGNGGICSGVVTVGVPHDVKDTAVDGGALFDSTI